MIDSFKGKYFFLSNFYPGDRTSLEHKYQASKTLNAIDRAEIREAATPGKAKRLGNKVDLRPNWDEAIRVLSMWTLEEEKYNDVLLQELLLATGEELLLEGNKHHDNFWGDCSCDRIKCLENPGHNILGMMLMALRHRIRKNLTAPVVYIKGHRYVFDEKQMEMRKVDNPQSIYKVRLDAV